MIPSPPNPTSWISAWKFGGVFTCKFGEDVCGGGSGGGSDTEGVGGLQVEYPTNILLYFIKAYRRPTFQLPRLPEAEAGTNPCAENQ